MKAIAIKMKNRATGLNVVNNNDLSKRIRNTLFGTLGLFALCYVFLVGSMVFNIVERKTIESDARNLANEVGNLELEYLATSNKVDLALAGTLGFKEVKTNYAKRTTLGSIRFAKNEL